MDLLRIERVGGLAGFGLPGSKLKSEGDLLLSRLTEAERTAIDALFAVGEKAREATADGFRYRITRQTAHGPETVELPEKLVPSIVRDSVKDTLG